MGFKKSVVYWSQLLPSLKPRLCTPLFPIMGLYPKNGHGGSIYTMEISNHYKPGLFPWRVNTYQHTTIYVYFSRMRIQLLLSDYLKGKWPKNNLLRTIHLKARKYNITCLNKLINKALSIIKVKKQGGKKTHTEKYPSFQMVLPWYIYYFSKPFNTFQVWSHLYRGNKTFRLTYHKSALEP